MDLEPISTLRIVALMAAGLIFSFVGLYLMVRPRPSGTASSRQQAGNASGLVVFIVGAAFIAFTLFLPEHSSRIPDKFAMDRPEQDEIRSETAQASAQESESVSPSPAVAEHGLRKTLVEEEPNDTIIFAIQLPLGQSATGDVAYRDSDWYEVPFGEVMTEHEIKIRRLNDKGKLIVTAFDAREQALLETTVTQSAEYVRIDQDPGDTLYLRVLGDSSFTGSYEIVVKPVSSD